MPLPGFVRFDEPKCSICVVYMQFHPQAWMGIDARIFPHAVPMGKDLERINPLFQMRGNIYCQILAIGIGIAAGRPCSDMHAVDQKHCIIMCEQIHCGLLSRGAEGKGFTEQHITVRVLLRLPDIFRLPLMGRKPRAEPGVGGFAGMAALVPYT